MGKQLKQKNSDFPLPSHFGQNPKAFELRNIVLPACPGSSIASPLGITCQEHLSRDVSTRQSNQMPKPPHLAPDYQYVYMS